MQNLILDLTPELCDRYPEKIRVLEPMLTNMGGKECFYGQVVTIKCHEDNSLVRQQVSQAGQGRVLVIDGGGSLRRALLGDQLAETAMHKGWAGFIIYGCIRDVNAIAALDIGVQALDAHPMKTEKHGIGEINVPVTFGGVTIHPGEYVYADNNGMLVAAEQLAW